MLSAQDCLHDLERLSYENSSDTRREMLRRVTDLFFATEEQRQSTDTELFGSAMDQLAYALEAEARIELSNRLAKSGKAPRKLLLKMANDDIDIAQPLLEESTCLTDDDLISIASNSSQDHLMAMTKRETLSTSVTDVIVERGDDSVVESVVLNKGATFSNQGLEQLSHRSVANEQLLASLASRDDLPENFLTEVKEKVAQKLAAELNDEDLNISQDDINSVVENKLNQISNHERGQESKAEAFAKRHRVNPFEEDDVVNFARARQVEDAVISLSLMTKLEPEMIRHCLLEADLAALGILCKASDFKDNTYAALLQLRLNLKGMPSNLAIEEMKRYQNLTSASAQRVLRFLKVRLTASKD